MAKIHVGVNGTARRIKRAFIGDEASLFLTAENFMTYPRLVNQGVTVGGNSPTFGTCMYFNGSSRLLIPSIPALSGTDWTIDWLEWPTVAPGGARFCSSYTTASGSCGGILLGYQGNYIHASTSADASSWNLTAQSGMFTTTANAWTHWAVVKQGSSLKTYRNGTLYASTTCNGIIGVKPDYYMSIGDYREGDHSYFTGYIDFFRISNHARWKSNFTSPTGCKTANGIARKVKKIYIGVNGVARLVAEERSISLSFNSNGATGGSAPGTQTKTRLFSKGETVTFTIPSHSLSRSGYIFLGWNTKSDGSGTAYVDGASVTISSSLTLYAVWIAAITITYTKSRTIPSNASWATSDWDTGPMNCLAIEYWAPSICSTYGKSWTIEAGRSFGNNQTLTVPSGGSIFVWCKNKYVSNTSFSTGPVYCDIFYNGSSIAYGSPISHTFSNVTKNVYINAEWDYNGAAPTIGIGSSWWDVSVNY